MPNYKRMNYSTAQLNNKLARDPGQDQDIENMKVELSSLALVLGVTSKESIIHPELSDGYLRYNSINDSIVVASSSSSSYFNTIVNLNAGDTLSCECACSETICVFVEMRDGAYLPDTRVMGESRDDAKDYRYVATENTSVAVSGFTKITPIFKIIKGSTENEIDKLKESVSSLNEKNENLEQRVVQIEHLGYTTDQITEDGETQREINRNFRESLEVVTKQIHGEKDVKSYYADSLSGGYYSGSSMIGYKYTEKKSSETSTVLKSSKYEIHKGETIELKTSMLGSTGAKPYIIVGSGNIVIAVGEVGEDLSNPLIYEVTADGYIYVNLRNTSFPEEEYYLKVTSTNDHDSILKRLSNLEDGRKDDNPLSVVKETAGYTAILHKIGVIGASFSNGYHNINSGSPNLPVEEARNWSWVQRLAKLCGIECFNFGRAGFSCKSWLNSEYPSEIEVEDKKCTAYIISLAANDISTEYGGKADYPLGSISDIVKGNENENALSYYGYLSKIIARVKSVQPRSYIFVMTYPLDYGGVESLGYHDAMRSVAELYNAYLIDYAEYGTTIDEMKSSYMFRGAHPVATMYQKMAYEVCTYIDWIIRHNMKDFADVAFVGTDCHKDWVGQADGEM